MSDHDPLCRIGEHSVNCTCDVIREARADQDEKSRADEREQIAARYMSETLAKVIEDACADERERIAQAIEADAIEKWEGDWYARIARTRNKK